MESEPLVLGIDAGTSSLRAALFDLTGAPVTASDVPYEVRYPKPGWAEQHPEAWWTAMVRAVRQCVSAAAVSSERIVGLAVDSPCNVVLARHNGMPLLDSILWMDLRASEQARLITATHDPVLRYCGGDVPAEWPLPKALWLRQQLPSIWEQTDYVVDEMSWLTHKLTGNWVAGLNSLAVKWHYRPTADEHTEAGWPIRLLGAIGLDDLPMKVPHDVVPLGASAGQLTPEAAQALALPAGITVAMGGIDAYAGMVGIDALQSGIVALITGTSTCQLVQNDHSVFHAGLWGPFESAMLPGAWTLEAGQASTGGTVRWLLDKFGGDLATASNRYAQADALAAEVPPGAEGLTVLDFWQGSRTPVKDPLARGVIFGLTTAHGVGHLLRAVYEATAFGNRHILETFASLGVPIGTIRACGGGTRSQLWLQILADVAGVPITLTAVDDAVAFGSAICAAVASGHYASLTEATSVMVRETVQIDPASDTFEMYHEAYDRYRSLMTTLRDEFHRAGAVQLHQAMG